MKKPLLASVLRTTAGPLTLAAALSCSACIPEQPSAHYTGAVIAEASIDATTQIVFVDEGGGDVGVAEISRVGEASIIMDMFRREQASPLEIFLATADESEEAPELLIENHRAIASLQEREDLTPRRLTLRMGERESPGSTPAGWSTGGTTACTAAGWEGAAGAWGNPVDSWANIFDNKTQPYTNNVAYPTSQAITQLAAWNGGGGSFHSHGACINKDTSDGKISFAVYLNNNFNAPVFSANLFQHVGNDDYVIYNDYISTNNTVTTSRITNAGNSSATFRHSAAAWVPNPQ